MEKSTICICYKWEKNTCTHADFCNVKYLPLQSSSYFCITCMYMHIYYIMCVCTISSIWELNLAVINRLILYHKIKICQNIFCAYMTVRYNVRVFSLQSPVVKVSVENLDFGLIQLGRSASLQFEVINESHCTVSFQLQQLVKQKKVFMVSTWYAVQLHY